VLLLAACSTAEAPTTSSTEPTHAYIATVEITNTDTRDAIEAA